MVPESYYVGLSAILFTIGVVGVVIRRNPLVMFMSIELMLNAANLALVAFGRRVGNPDGQAVVFFAMAVAAAEVAVGLAIIVTIFRLRRRLSVDDLSLMRWLLEGRHGQDDPGAERAVGPRRGRRAGAAAPARHAPDPPLRGEGGGGLRPGQGRRVPPPLHRRGGGRGRRHLGPPRRRLRDLRLPRSRPLPRQGRRPEAADGR